MTTVSRHRLCWITAVYWLFVGATEVSGSYDSVSCSREGRSFQPRPQVPCDLVKNTFCDTSGDSYPWSQLRKFVFENQGLIKRMYGYQTHYAILKDELLDMLDGADQLLHDPLEMYRPENQIPDPDEKLQPSKVRNSVRSNAFRGRTIDEASLSYEDRLGGVGGQPSETEKELFDRATLLEDYGEEQHSIAAEEEPDRRRNERHLDARSPSSRAMNLSKSPPPNSGRRSIAAPSFNKDQTNGGRHDDSKRPYKSKERMEEKKLADSDRLASIRITQSYSTKATAEGRVATQASSSLAVALDQVDEEAREDGISEAPASAEGPLTSSPSSAEATLSTPGVSQETTLRYSEEVVRPTGPQGDLPDVSSTSYEVPTTAPDEPLDADEWVTAGPSAYVYTSRESADEGTTVSVSSTATRPPVSHSPTSVEPPLLYTTLPPVEPEEPTTTFTSGDSNESDVTTNVDESITVELIPVEVSAKYKEDKKQPTRDQLPSDSLTVEQRTSEGVKLNSYNSHEGPEVVKTTPSSVFANSEEHVFRFPDEVEVSVPILNGFNPDEDEAESHQQDQKLSSNNSRRQSNTRRPASAESRQPSPNRRRPSESWTTPEGQDNPSPDVDGRNPTRPFASPSRSPPGRGTATVPTSDSRLTGGIIPGVERRPGGARPQQQAMWRRPDLDEEERPTTTTITTTSHRPPPPTPSTVPTPSHTVHFKKGVNACPVETDVVAPYWANNTRGEVLALLNLAPFEQYVHWEKCRFEYRQMYCRPGCRCEQQYRLHRMLAFDPSNDCRGIFSDWFRFPSGCVCKCYDLPEEVARSAAAYNRSPRVSENLEFDDFTNDEEESEQISSNLRELKSIGLQGRANAAVGDLSDVYFESEDDLLPLDAPEPAQDRMDEGFSYEQFISSEDDDVYESPPTVNNIRNEPVKDDEENIKEMRNKIVDDVVAVLEREPVHSLYSRAESALTKPKVPLASITPQRRPRPHVFGQRRTSGFSQPVQQVHFKMPNQPHGYNLRFGQSTHVLQYTPPNVISPLGRFQYQQNQMARNRYIANSPRYRSLNTWNPQASFPATLSNPRFKKYLDTNAQANPHQPQVFPNSPAGSNNLNLNHLMKPGPPVAPILPSAFAPTPTPSEGPAVTFGTLDVQTPHYYFNLTSHLIRTQQLDDRRIGSSNYKSREPRSLKPGKETSLTEERSGEDERNPLEVKTG